uniref:S1 motif domain-containing protein n=1 Tax=Odontella aurita TaxID=265563 RepID=A0A7S4MUR0_9STRA
MPRRSRRIAVAATAAAAAAAVLLSGSSSDAFQPGGASPLVGGSYRTTRRRSSTLPHAASEVAEDEEEEDTLLFSDEWEDGVPPPEEEEEEDREEQTAPWKRNARWNSLNPNVKARIVEEAQEQAIRNKKRREPSADKKRRMMMFYKEISRKKKRDTRTVRPTPVGSSDRVPLSDIQIGSTLPGTVISLTNFGAYVDVGTECDGLLHVSQITRKVFVQHPREVLRPGDEVEVRVVRSSPELKKMQLTMLPTEEEPNPDDESQEDPILLDELAVDDELWGEIRRVTSYGGYVELGAEVDGFLHFMDHPEFGRVPGAPPGDYMAVGDRVRVWVSDLDREKVRVKLTANRPEGLPGPRREMRRA